MHKNLLHCGNCIINVIGLCTLSYLHIFISQETSHFKENTEQAPFLFLFIEKICNDYYSECTLSLNCLGLRQRLMIRETGVTRGNKFRRK